MAGFQIIASMYKTKFYKITYVILGLGMIILFAVDISGKFDWSGTAFNVYLLFVILLSLCERIIGHRHKSS